METRSIAPQDLSDRVWARASGLFAVLALGMGIGCKKPEPFDPLEIRGFDHSGYNSPRNIPTQDLPEGKLVVNLREIAKKGLLNRPLTVAPERVPWPSSFFPSWYGGAAGRWQDGRVRLLWRSLFGTNPPSPDSITRQLEQARAGDASARAFLYRLSPTEKYDLAAGDYEFHATQSESLARGHNMPSLLKEAFWSGYCNGVSFAAMRYAEPLREVDVVNPDGHEVRFHPQDVKALLSLAHVHTYLGAWNVGHRCNELSMSSPACVDVNPAAFVIGLVNRVGLARKSFVIDENPLSPVVNSAIREATVTLLSEPYAGPSGFGQAPYLVDARIDVWVASSLLDYEDANKRASSREGAFEPARAPTQPLTYFAQLALDRDFDLIGGRWLGTRMSGPDFFWGAAGDPNRDVQRQDHLIANKYMRWSFLYQLHQKSISSEPQIPRLDFSATLGSALDTIVATRVAKKPNRVYEENGEPVELVGFMSSEGVRKYHHVSFFESATKTGGPGERFINLYHFPKEGSRPGRMIFKLEGVLAIPGSRYVRAYFYPNREDLAANADIAVAELSGP